ncbi:hypothetical protein [Flavihumibacter petaseus]|nr:hypothetical protein [Flavihumibacter petaseus]
MKLNKIYDIEFDTEDTIVAATLSKINEVVMLMSSGSVVRFNLDDRAGRHLFSVKSEFGYPDGGFDLTAKSSIYTMDEIVVVVNDFKRHGFVHFPGKYYALHLWREGYHADISVYPIALYKNSDGVPHLIYGEAWNHIQIMNLETRQILTASKSLIEENAEERHIEQKGEYNELAWPRPYDYFFGELIISPDQKKFLSAGWAWGSCDCFNVYDIEVFIKSNRISALNIGVWEHENRPTCWIDNETIAVAYSPFTERDESSTAESLNEIHLYKISGDDVNIEKRVQTADNSILGSGMYYSAAMNSFITVSDKTGLSIISYEGDVTFKDESLKVVEYNGETGRFLAADNKAISVYELIA